MKKEFSTFDIVKALEGIPRERLREWLDRGFISPSIPADGQGTKAVFSVSDVYGIALFRNLLSFGFSRAVAGDYVKQFLREEKSQPEQHRIAFILFRVSRKEGTKAVSVITMGRGDWQIDLLTGMIGQTKILSRLPRYKGWDNKDWQMLHVINFESLRQEVDAALAKL